MINLSDVLMTLQGDEWIEFRGSRRGRFVEFRVSKGHRGCFTDVTVNVSFPAITGCVDSDLVAAEVDVALREVREKHSKSQKSDYTPDPYYDDFIHGHYDDGRGTA